MCDEAIADALSKGITSTQYAAVPGYNCPTKGAEPAVRGTNCPGLAEPDKRADQVLTALSALGSDKQMPCWQGKAPDGSKRFINVGHVVASGGKNACVEPSGPGA